MIRMCTLSSDRRNRAVDERVAVETTALFVIFLHDVELIFYFYFSGRSRKWGVNNLSFG